MSQDVDSKSVEKQAVRQLTIRAIVTGCIIGAILTPCNVYSGLKIGWSFNMSIAAALLSYGFYKLVGAKEWGLLENNVNQTTASAAASIISAGIVAPIPAYTMLTGETLSLPVLSIWCFVVSFTGVVVAIGLRKQMLVRENLPFPAGTATAETVKEIYSAGTEAVRRVRWLLSMAALSALLKWLTFKIANFPRVPLFPGSIPAGAELSKKGLASFSPYKLGFLLDPSLLMIGFGMIIGTKAGISLLIGAVFAWGILPPFLLHWGWVHIPTGNLWFGELVEWLLWPGVVLMVATSLSSFFISVYRILKKAKAEGEAKDEDFEEVPRSWFSAGIGLALIFAVSAQSIIFGIPIWIAVLAVLLTFVLAVVSCRVSGETGIAPIGALGKVTQLTFGVLHSGSVSANLMTANVTGGAAGQSSDLLHDLKTGQLIGASVKAQLIGQVFGIMVGSVVGSLAYLTLIPDPAKMLLTDEWPAPAVATWKAVAEVFQQGVSGIPQGAILAMGIALVIGLIFGVLEQTLSEKNQKILPSASSMGLAFMLPAWNSVSMFLGAMVLVLLKKWNNDFAVKTGMAIAAGLVAGESLMGVGLAIYSMVGG